MRNLLILLIVVVLALIAVIATGLVDVRQTSPAQLPEVSVSGDGVEATGGRQPTFDVETGSVSVGSETRAVTVPKLEVEPAPDAEAERSNESTDRPAGS